MGERKLSLITLPAAALTLPGEEKAAGGPPAREEHAPSTWLLVGYVRRCSSNVRRLSRCHGHEQMGTMPSTSLHSTSNLQMK